MYYTFKHAIHKVVVQSVQRIVYMNTIISFCYKNAYYYFYLIIYFGVGGVNKYLNVNKV